ncbi:MAG: lysine transporter LysE [Betaproteobacteria bacterium]|jgi:leucine efflux protein|nr:LysE family transporter [Burkholderiaceae bacterium]NDF65035.1 lysine transporter LysE [Betaproteobacteria bacterium]
MLGITDFPAFVLAILVFLAIPGPGNLALLVSTAKGGLRGGLASTLGIMAGDQVLIWLAVLGVSAVLLTWPTVLTAVQWLGALYLAVLGWKMIRSRPGVAPVLDIAVGQYCRQSCLITLFNPKAIVFYMAFFPLFVDPQQPPSLATFGVMALTVAVLTFFYGAVLVLLAHRLSSRVRANPWVARALNTTAGALLMGFGLKLALTK